MTMHLGDVPAGITLYIPFATYGKTNGESITLTGLAVTDIEIYKNGSVTQRASDAGYALLDTDGIDFDGITGIHGFSVDLNDNTDAGFYSVGGFYWVVVSAVTVDSQTVNFVAATFRIVAAEAVTGKPKVDVDAWLGTAAATPTVAGVPEVDATHVAGTAQTAGDLAVLITTVDDLLDTEVAAIKAKTDNLPAAPAATGDAMTLTAAAVDAILDDAVEGSTTLRQLLRGFAAALLAKASGLATTTATYRDLADTKDRITATVDADGNRSAVTLDLT